MNKEDILNRFDGEELTEALKIYNGYIFSSNKNMAYFSKEFITPNVWSFFEKEIKDLDIKTQGFFQDSDRRVLSINNIYDEEYPCVIIKIKSKSKFKKLNHKDYLGAILSLGIKREKFGDLVVGENEAYVPMMNDIYEYISTNLTKVNSSPVELELLSGMDNLPKPNYEEIITTISSLRIDSLVAGICNLSRTEALNYIKSSKVLIDYGIVDNKSKTVKENSKITVRGKGKFIFEKILGENKKGRMKVLVKKYT